MCALRTHILLFLVMVYVWLATGCGNTPRAADNAPIHLHMVCPAGEDGQSVSCDPGKRLEHFNSWVKNALSRQHSTFSIWAVGPSRQRYHLFFAACVPPQWGSSVRKRKADSVVMARQGVSGNQTGLKVPERCRSPEPQTSGIHQP